jgi:hypothetical protein
VENPATPVLRNTRTCVGVWSAGGAGRLFLLRNFEQFVIYLRLSTYAINAFKSSGGRSIGGMPPAVIFGVGCLKSSTS